MVQECRQQRASTRCSVARGFSFTRGGVGWSLTTRLNPLTGLRLDQCCSRATSYNPPHRSFSIFQIRNSHIEQTVVEKRSKRIYRTSKCFRHAIKHLGLCVKHTLTLRPRNFLFFSAPQTSAHYSLAPDRQPVFIIRPEQNW